MQSTSINLLRGVLMAAALALAAGGCGSSTTSEIHIGPAAGPDNGSEHPGAGKPRVTLGTKNFTESLILGQLYAQALKAKGYSVTLKPNLGASEVMEGKLSSGEIGGYPEYTGTILSVLAHDSRRIPSAQAAYRRAAAFERRHGARLLDMAAAADTDVVIARPAYASAHHLSSLSDLAELGSSAVLAAPPEFRTRFNGSIGLRQDYGVTRLGFLPLKIGRQYQALDSGHAQLAAAFTTDGQLSAGRYALLRDPKNIFGFQNVAFVVRQDVAGREGPAFAQTINAVSAKLSTQALRVMNAAVVLDQQNPAAVARQFLGANGLG